MFVLSGTVDSLHLGDLLEWLHLTRATGRLLLAANTVTRAFDIVRGKVAFASSSRAAERLGSWLLRQEQVPYRTLLHALTVAQTTGETFTTVVEREAGLGHDALLEAGRSLATALASRAMRESRISFSFDPDYPVTDRLHVDLQLECSKLIMDAAYSVDTRPPADQVIGEPPVTFDPEAVDALFWRIAADLEGELVDAAAFAAANETLAKVGALLHRWVTQGLPLLPLGPDAAERVASRLQRAEPVRIEDSPTLAWNVLSLVNGLDAPGLPRATGLHEAWTLAAEDAPLLVRLIIDNTRWRRERHDSADSALLRTAVARAAAGRSLAPLLGLDEETAATAAALPVVTLELVATALAHAPLASGSMQRVALRHLLPLVGHAAGNAAGYPEVLLTALTGKPEEHAGARIAAWAAAAAQEAGSGIYPGEPVAASSSPKLAAAMKAARKVARRAVADVV
jgi:hypothetical protein